MNITPYENHIKAQKAEFLSMDDFLEKIQHIIMTGGHNFLIQKERLEKLTSLQLTQTIGKSQNFLSTGLVQLREEILMKKLDWHINHLKQNFQGPHPGFNFPHIETILDILEERRRQLLLDDCLFITDHRLDLDNILQDHRVILLNFLCIYTANKRNRFAIHWEQGIVSVQFPRVFLG